ncbi:MarR family transcriptional regulator [Streptomyces sp. SID3343]|uniref:MarR family winged helix-turn-helix transcriptional regulator n=1 Tax=Streptomyces sp. SID3343 TaxID=2690260 RepID=UPI0013689341|nr:MarR family transcriptional regulator [Streptomyces sp. SID3343]MYV99801.1 MarR family transcriptional regulator [Streptomyces sp. SID3343]
MATQEACRYLLTQMEGIAGVHRSIAKALPTGVLPPGVSVLYVLGRSDQPLRAGRVAELLEIDMSVVSRHITHLVDHGWVERRPNPEDGRSCLLALTPEGHAVVANATEGRLAVVEDRLRDWSDTDAEQLADLLRRLRSSLGYRADPLPVAVSH